MAFSVFRLRQPGYFTARSDRQATESRDAEPRFVPCETDPADKRIADYEGEDNVRKFREIVDKFRKA
jgi:hypothetical protein